MPCLSPIVIKNRRYKDSFPLRKYCEDVVGFDNCIVIPDEDNPDIKKVVPFDYYIKIPCGTCFYCLKRKRSDWSLRLQYEIMAHKESTFVTLTFDDFYLEKFKDDYKKPIKLYIDRLRKFLGFRPRYFFISEYGEDDRFTHRFHFHGIIFGTSKEVLSYSTQKRFWHYGIADAGWVNFKTANYLTKYLLKMQNGEKPIMLCSNGIGKKFLEQKNVTLRYLNNYNPLRTINFNGRLYAIPSYYKSKIFDDDMKVEIMKLRAQSQPEYFLRLYGTEFRSLREYLRSCNIAYRSSLLRGTSLQSKAEYKPLNLINVDYSDHEFSITNEQIKLNKLWSSTFSQNLTFQKSLELK